MAVFEASNTFGTPPQHPCAQAAALPMPFALLQSVDVGAAVTAAALSPTLDVLALAQADGAILLLRWMSWTRITAIASGLRDGIVSLVWSPDGEVAGTMWRQQLPHRTGLAHHRRPTIGGLLLLR